VNGASDQKGAAVRAANRMAANSPFGNAVLSGGTNVRCSRFLANNREASMPGNSRQADAPDRNPLWVDIGRGLTRMYDDYLHSPMPERLAALLARLDAPEQQGMSSGSPHRGAIAG